MNKLLNGLPLDLVTIQRLREWESAAVEMHPDGYYIAISGGKDSDVIYDLVRRSGVKATYHHHLTTVDPPEAVRHIRKHMPRVQFVRPRMSMAALIRKRGCPPRRNARFCCEYLKENGGFGRIVVTGVRWAESSRRGRRRMMEACYRKRGRKFLNLIIDWTTEEVWEYLYTRGLPFCGLYKEGWKRIGCVLCPMTRNTQQQIERWPAIAKVWERAIKSTWRPPDGGRFTFPSPEAYWQWWLDRDARRVSSDPVLFEDDPGLSRQSPGSYWAHDDQMGPPPKQCSACGGQGYVETGPELADFAVCDRCAGAGVDPEQ